MTDTERRELRDFMAERVMRFERINTSYYQSPSEGYERGGYVCENWDWLPDTDANQTLMLIEKMREPRPDGSDGFNFNFNWQAHKGIKIALAQFHRIDGNLEHGQGASDNPLDAILLAIKKALENKR